VKIIKEISCQTYYPANSPQRSLKNSMASSTVSKMNQFGDYFVDPEERMVVF
jgi:hypothetical protein